MSLFSFPRDPFTSQDTDETALHRFGFPEMVSLVCKPTVVAVVCVAALGGKDAECGGPGLVWFHVVCGCEAG